MSSYYSSFNYLGINSRSKNLVVAHFDADSGESETFLNIEPIYTDSASGIRRLDYGAKYGSVAIFRINVIKPDGNEFSVTEIRDCLKWLTGSISNSTLDLLIGDQIKYSFIGRITNVWQYKMDAKTVGLILEFTSSSPFAYSPKQNVSCSVSGTKTLQIHCPSDDLNSYVYMQTTYENTSGTSLTIENITTEDKTEVKELATNEIITIDNNIMITSDKQGKTFGNTFNFCFPRLTSGINNLIITANGNITFEYSYPIKIGDLAIDTDELNGAIDCESGAGTGTVVTEYISWENILNKPPTVSESIEDFYTKDEVNTILMGKLDNIEGSVKRKNIDTNAVGTDEIDSGAVDTVNIADGAVTTIKIADSSITTQKIATGAIDALKLAPDAVRSSNIAQHQITTDHLKNKVITHDKLSDEVTTLINNKADKATTLEGYGIKDAYTKNEIDANTEKIANKVYTKNEEISDESYPSIAYLDSYYYEYTEVDNLLANKLDNAKNSVQTNNIADQSITTDKLSDEVQMSINEKAKIADVNEQFADKADKSTTLSGYGITDAYTKSESKSRFGLNISVTFDENYIPLTLDTSSNLTAGNFAASSAIVKNVKYVFVSSQVRVINTGTFANCTNLTDVYINNVASDISISDGAIPNTATIHYVDDFNTNDYIIQALMSINSIKLPLCELKENKIHEITKIIDSDVQYPSITYLHNYYYKNNEVDGLLSTKLDNSNGSVATNNIAEGAVTLSRLSDDVQTLINSGGSGGGGISTVVIDEQDLNNMLAEVLV